MVQFSKKWVLITGASSGIGKAFAKKLASQGANLVLVARREALLQELAATLKEQHGIEAVVIPKDLSRLEAPQELFDAVQKSGIIIDVLVNNAGFGVYGKFHETNLERNQEMLKLNILALSALTQLFLPGMLAKKSGIVINISSLAGFFPMLDFENYSASKAFVRSFTEALWLAYKDDGIQFLTVCPSSTQTDFHRIAKMKPSQKLVDTPEQVVEQAIKALNKNKIYVITCSLKNFILGQLPRILTHKLVTKLAAQNRHPKNKTE